MPPLNELEANMIATAPRSEKGTLQPMTNHARHSTIVDRLRGPRIALYSHDTMGIGHMRRNQLIAQTLAQAPCHGRVLMIAGANEASVFASHSGIDSLTLPSLHKDIAGKYSPRHLDVPLSHLIELRRRIILAAMQAFRPDVFIVDKVPRGVAHELDETLAWLTSTKNTRCVLGLREVLDTPVVVKRQWRTEGFRAAIDEHFHQVWVYGDRRVFDSVREYGLNDIAEKTRFTGYLNQAERLASLNNNESVANLFARHGFESGLQLAACFVGGGQDGFDLASAFCQSALQPSMSAVIVCGPCMPSSERQRLQQMVAGDSRKLVVDSMVEADSLMHFADRVVAMGGYNTVCSVLSCDKPALIVPRVSPRQEQMIRANRLCELNVLDVLHPSHLSPAAISQWLFNPNPKRPSSGPVIDLLGLDRIPQLLHELFRKGPSDSFCTKVTTNES